MASSAKKYYAGNGNYYTLENGRMVLRRQNGTAIYRNGKLVTSNKVSYIQKRDKQKKNTSNNNSGGSNQQASSRTSNNTTTNTSTSTTTNTDTTNSNSTNTENTETESTKKKKDIEYDPEEFVPETPYTENELIHKNSPAHFVMLDVYETDEENWKPYNTEEDKEGDTLEEVKSQADTEDLKNTTEENEEEEVSVDIDSLLEEAKKETEEEDKGYFLHQGEIKETHNYYQTFNASYDGDYTGFKNSGKIKFPTPKKEDLKHLYKGVRCLLKYGKFHPNNTKKEIKVKPVFLSFITDSSFDKTSVDFSLEDEGALLEEKDELSYNNTLRSEILKEVIRHAGLTPEVDFRGLQDEIIDWTSVTSSGGSSGGSVAGQSTKYTDCSTTHEISHGTGCYVNKRGAKPSPIPSAAQEKICNTSANYYTACKGKSAKEVMSLLRNGWHYKLYSDNRHKCASQSWSDKNLNCGDSARLLKACMDAANVPAIIIHVSGHYYNAINDGSGWKTVDLCYRSQLGVAGTTNELGY